MVNRPDDSLGSFEIRGGAIKLWRSTEDETLLCGPAGTGKSRAVLELIHKRLCEWPGARALIVRKHRASLTESGLVTYEDFVLGPGHPIIGKLKREGRHAYHYPNGSTLVVGGADNPERLFSTEYDIIYPQELIEFEEDEYENLKRALRRGAIPLQQILADTNPSYPSHWVKKRCDSGPLKLIESRIQDNPAYWDLANSRPTERGVKYLANLSGMTGVRRKRLLQGVWSAAEEQWFDQWDEDLHVRAEADFDPALPVHLSIDPGVYTGSVLWQVRPAWLPGYRPRVTVFADYLGQGISPRANGTALTELAQERCGTFNPKLFHRTCDPAAGARQGNGITLKAEYEAAGLKLESWPLRPVNDGLELIASLLEGIGPDGERCLLVHPRCKLLRDAFASYSRAKRQNQWLDKPEDPQHPHEDLMDALRGGLVAKFPDGLGPEPQFHRVHAGRAF